MANRVSIKNFGGMKNGENSFYFNLTPTEGGDSLTSLTKMKFRKQKGMPNVTNLGIVVSMCTASKEQ